jgi:hypothetical protein
MSNVYSFRERNCLTTLKIIVMINHYPQYIQHEVFDTVLSLNRKNVLFLGAISLHYGFFFKFSVTLLERFVSTA